MPPILEVDGLVKQYGDFVAVKGISFAVEEGGTARTVSPVFEIGGSFAGPATVLATEMDNPRTMPADGVQRLLLVRLGRLRSRSGGTKVVGMLGPLHLRPFQVTP